MVDHPKQKISDGFDGGHGGGPPQQTEGTTPTDEPSVKPVAMPVSKIQIEDLKKRLSTPRIAAEFTPQGAATKQIRSEKDQSLLEEIKSQTTQLNKRKGAMQEAFDRANENKTVRRGPKR